jgi:hypothetical protein
MSKKTIIKRGKRIKGFVYKDEKGWWYAFGKPSQDCYIAFACKSESAGVAAVEMKTF